MVKFFFKRAVTGQICLMQLCTRLRATSVSEHDNQCAPLQRILDEFAVSELLHTFPSVVKGNEEGDTGLATMTNSSYFYNIWQVDFLKLPRGDRLPKPTLNYVEQVSACTFEWRLRQGRRVHTRSPVVLTAHELSPRRCCLACRPSRKAQWSHTAPTPPPCARPPSDSSTPR